MDHVAPSESLTEDAPVTLREVTEETLQEVCALKVSSLQESYVADNAYSIAQAYFSKAAWFRTIYAGDTPVGFVMLHDDPEENITCGVL